MIIKAKKLYYFDFILLFYSKLLEKSKLLNSYFFYLKFLNIFTVNKSIFYYYSKNFMLLQQNRIHLNYVTFIKKKYTLLDNSKNNKHNYYLLLFNNLVRKKYLLSRLI